MDSVDLKILSEAIERNSAAVLALPSAGMVRYHKTRFLRAEGDRIWVESVVSETVLIESLVLDHQPVVVSFKMGNRKASFASPISQLDRDYKFFDTIAPLQAIEIVRPPLVKPVQRRSHYRVPVRDSDRFTIRLWRISEQVDVANEPLDLAYIPASVHDLSVGGVGVIFADRPLLIPEQRMRILLKHGAADPMLIEGRSGPVRPIGGTSAFQAGLQFQHLQDSLGGRRLTTELTRIVQNLQLAEAKRLRGVA